MATREARELYLARRRAMPIYQRAGSWIGLICLGVLVAVWVYALLGSLLDDFLGGFPGV